MHPRRHMLHFFIAGSVLSERYTQAGSDEPARLFQHSTRRQTIKKLH